MFDVAVPFDAQAVQAGIGACGDAAVAIHEVQGRERSSPFAGAALGAVTVEAVVVGAFEGLPDGLGGFFLQEESSDVDDDPLTSEGLFVYTGPDGLADTPGQQPPRAGDVLRVRGRVREYFGLTEITQVEAWTRCATAPLPDAVAVRLPRSDAGDWERWEGMRVRLAQPLLVADQFAALRFGELDLAVAHRPWQPTHVVEPGAPAALARHNLQRARILLDDGLRSFEPAPPPWLSTAQALPLRLGDRATLVEGVVDFAFGRYRIQPTRPARLETARRSRPLVAVPPVEGRLRVTAWNVENLFNGDGRGGGFPTRGAASPFEYERQLAKIVETLVRLDADIVALAEVENDGISSNGALADLTRALRTRGFDYSVVDAGAPVAGHATAVALLYRDGAVVPEGEPMRIDGAVAPGFDAGRNRPSLVQAFRHRATGERLTVVANHWKSKGSSCELAGDPDVGDGQGECNATRRAAARAVLQWLGARADGAPTAPALLLGDLNAYPREDPLVEFAAAGWVDVIEAFAGAQAYTTVFDGGRGRLDHALASPALLHAVAGAAVWNLNSDESRALDYRADRPAGFYRADPRRASDHDPILVGLFHEREEEGPAETRASGHRGAGLRRVLRWLRARAGVVAR